MIKSSAKSHRQWRVSHERRFFRHRVTGRFQLFRWHTRCNLQSRAIDLFRFVQRFVDCAGFPLSWGQRHFLKTKRAYDKMNNIF